MWSYSYFGSVLKNLMSRCQRSFSICPLRGRPMSQTTFSFIFALFRSIIHIFKIFIAHPRTFIYPVFNSRHHLSTNWYKFIDLNGMNGLVGQWVVLRRKRWKPDLSPTVSKRRIYVSLWILRRITWPLEVRIAMTDCEWCLIIIHRLQTP